MANKQAIGNKMSVSEYKEYFDKNNFQGDKYQTALFIKFLMDNKVKNTEIYELTKVKKSQITNYKKIKDLKTETLRGIIRDIDNEKKRPKEPEVKQKEEPEAKQKEAEEDQDLISDFEKMGIDEDAHYAEIE